MILKNHNNDEVVSERKDESNQNNTDKFQTFMEKLSFNKQGQIGKGSKDEEASNPSASPLDLINQINTAKFNRLTSFIQMNGNQNLP
jgi:hypothetical protein